jgi:F0F1-type ATP synthase membrane subunit b/b'
MNKTDWKEKSIRRARETKSLKKRIRELAYSRDQWKTKYMEAKGEKDVYKEELIKIKKKLNQIISQ